MKKILIVVISFAVMIWVAGISTAAAQGRGRGQGAGKPASTGLEHAEATANAHGQKGIENAEAKQARTDKGQNSIARGKKKGHHKKHKKHSTTAAAH